jgi:hypothetical protein
VAAISDYRFAGLHLAAQADWLASALDAVPVASGPETWRGPVADRFAADLDDQRRRLRALADEMRAASQVLLIDADRIDGATATAGTGIDGPLRMARAW